MDAWQLNDFLFQRYFVFYGIINIVVLVFVYYFKTMLNKSMPQNRKLKMKIIH